MNMSPVRMVLLSRYVLRDRRIVLLAVAAGVASLCWIISMLIWAPVLQKHAALTVELRVLAEQHRRQLVGLEVQVAASEAQAQLKAWDERLVQQVDRVALMTAVVEMASSNGMTILGQTYEEAASGAGLSMLRQEISFQGQYENVRGFLFALPGLPGITRVEDLNIERATPEGVRGRLRLVNFRHVEQAQ
jgi:Tfp pilus assembly protein PilO